MYSPSTGTTPNTQTSLFTSTKIVAAGVEPRESILWDNRLRLQPPPYFSARKLAVFVFWYNKYDISVLGGNFRLFLTNHTLTGTLLALTIDNPVVLAPAAFGSHLLLDAIPHFGHPKLKLEQFNGHVVAAVDGLFSLGVYLTALSLWPERTLLISIAAFSAALPDLLYIPRHYLNYVPSKAFARFHKSVQWSETPPGAVVEVAWLLAMICALSQF